MVLSYSSLRSRIRLVCLTLLLIVALTPFLIPRPSSSRSSDKALEERFPLSWKHIHTSNGTGGAWYIPPEWMDGDDAAPHTIIEAARRVSQLTSLNPRRQVAFSNIPLLIHQTWKTTRIDTWDVRVIAWVEKWLEAATGSSGGSPMAYLFWDDEGIMAFMQEFESSFLEQFVSLFTPVERTDIFRILVCQRFGGIYGDIDTEPLKHPSTWIRQSDISAWTDPESKKTYGSLTPSKSPDKELDGTRPVSLLWGLEADTDPAADTYWRMGYTYPVQLTQWALASGPGHPVLAQFMQNLQEEIHHEKNTTPGPGNVDVDPLVRTGPAAVTLATKMYLEAQIDFRWNALTGLFDGGKAKLVSDILVLPMTGFSPGRGQYGNMGSKPVTDPDARLEHHTLGSWRHFDLTVEYGKLCRTVFGLCKDWSKVPGG